jgi:hypothetical protein
MFRAVLNNQPVIEIQTSLCKKSRHHQRSRVVDSTLCEGAIPVNGEQYGAVAAGGNFQLTYPCGRYCCHLQAAVRSQMTHSHLLLELLADLLLGKLDRLPGIFDRNPTVV